MAFKYEVKPYSTFGNCMYIENDSMEMVVTVDVGPRVIKLNLKGKDNMMFNDADHAIYHDEPNMKDMFGKDARWYIMGGHRFWVSPEKHPETYYPDNNPVAYTVKDNVFTFFAPKQIFTGWQEKLIITVDETKAKASLKHVLTNMSDRTQTGAIWGLNVTDKGGRAYAKQCDDATGLLANRVVMFWPYNEITDKRFYLDNEFIGVSQDRNAQKPYKIGVNNTNGVTLCVNHGTVFKLSAEYIRNAKYPDNGCNTEIYSCKNFLEVETLSPLYEMKPGESCEHVENWELFADDAVDVADLKKYF